MPGIPSATEGVKIDDPVPGNGGREGSALLAVMAFAALILAIVASIYRLSGTHTRISKGYAGMEEAFYTAEAGIERGASYVANGGAVPTNFTGTLGDGTYVVTILQGSSAAADDGSTNAIGTININPNNSRDNEFSVTLASGEVITRDDLTSDYPGYTGTATLVHVKPKGNGNQNGLLVNGAPYELENKNTYNISAATMSINIYNDNVNSSGKAMGHWYIAIAANNATITVAP